MLASMTERFRNSVSVSVLSRQYVTGTNSVKKLSLLHVPSLHSWSRQKPQVLASLCSPSPSPTPQTAPRWKQSTASSTSTVPSIQTQSQNCGVNTRPKHRSSNYKLKSESLFTAHIRPAFLEEYCESIKLNEPERQKLCGKAEFLIIGHEA